MRHTLIALTSTTLLLSGCAGMQTMQQNMTSLTQTSQAPTPEQQTEFGTYLASVAANLNNLTAYSDNSLREDQTLLRHNGRTLLNSSTLETRLNAILQRLQQAATTPAPVARIALVPAPEYEAFTLAGGTIFVSYGALATVESEDELAALLAHELGHVLLRHHVKDLTERLSDKALKYGQLYFLIQNGGASKKGFASAKAAAWAAENALFPSWNRDQESGADMIAVDLLARAGYRADALVSVLDHLEASSKKKEDLIASTPLTAVGDALAGGMNTDLLETAAKQFVSQNIGQNYQSAQDRRKTVRDYAKERWPEQRRVSRTELTLLDQLPDSELKRLQALTDVHRLEQDVVAAKLDTKVQMQAQNVSAGPMGQDPYTLDVLYYWAETNQDSAAAEQYLTAALATGQAPFPSYLRRVDALASAGNTAAALALSRQAADIFDEPPVLYPRMVGYYRQLNQNLMVSLYQTKCLATGDAELIQLCKGE